MVMALVGLDSQLCFVKDEQSMFPLQTAVIHGHGDVIRELIFTCPESLQMLTSQKETVFHLAAKNYHCDAFEVLFEEAKKLNQEHLLDEQDDEGNTILHIAVYNQLLPIVIKICHTSTDNFKTQINAVNKKGKTAMDLYYGIPDRGLATRQIGHILQIAGGREALQPLPNYVTTESTTPGGWFFETKNVLLVVLAIFIGMAFTVIFNLQAFFRKDNDIIASQLVFEFKDVATGGLPITFYIISSTTVAFTTSTCILKVLLYSLPCGHFMLLAGVATFILYVLLAYYIMPKFFVRVGSHYLSSSRLMWILVVGIIFSGALIIFIAKCFLMRSHKFTKWIKRKWFQINLLSHSNKRLPRSNPSVEFHMIGDTLPAAAPNS
ncbi:hypothetical protein Dsin_015120 [Dipteronia sinensis]|uniref:PGG domain-containing protein n=1 Tax=Dipteronia sinensis TaxID=43782 RepID=A0AAE0ANW9_9ROSI|nr:hypothetical protein Dsin_015120 [Dipteronia sinensis]